MDMLEGLHGLDNKKAFLALGMFDGVHIGHAHILRTCVERAHKFGSCAVVYTYKNPPHPQKLISGGLITPSDQKLALCKQIGISAAIVNTFTPAYAAMSCEEYVKELCKNDRTSALFCGYNYRFGAGGAGDSNRLKQLCEKYGVEVVSIDPVVYNGVPVSSTQIRAALLKGDCEHANKLLGHPFSVHTQFCAGKADWPEQAKLKPGVYECRIGEKMMMAEVNDREITCKNLHGEHKIDFLRIL